MEVLEFSDLPHNKAPFLTVGGFLFSVPDSSHWAAHHDERTETASRSSLNSMLQLSGEIEEAAIIQNIPWIKRMTRIIIPIQKSSIISGFLLPFMTCLRELSLFMLLCVQGFILSTTLDYFDEMGLYAFSSGINLILIVTILVCNTLVNKITGASLDKGIGG